MYFLSYPLPTTRQDLGSVLNASTSTPHCTPRVIVCHLDCRSIDVDTQQYIKTYITSLTKNASPLNRIARFSFFYSQATCLYKTRSSPTSKSDSRQLTSLNTLAKSPIPLNRLSIPPEYCLSSHPLNLVSRIYKHESLALFLSLRRRKKCASPSFPPPTHSTN